MLKTEQEKKRFFFQEAELDEDEQVNNPAYIPKHGPFYMHDSRAEAEEPLEEKRVSRADRGLWKHDRSYLYLFF